MKEPGATFLCFGHRSSLLRDRDGVLQLAGKGRWQRFTAEEFLRERGMTG